MTTTYVEVEVDLRDIDDDEIVEYVMRRGLIKEEKLDLVDAMAELKNSDILRFERLVEDLKGRGILES